jgi:regulator of telomere elongation helicase 1
MQRLMNEGVYSIILTSGTLSPISALISELNIKFKVKLENKHVVKKEQVYISVVTAGPDAEALDSSYDNRLVCNSF